MIGTQTKELISTGEVLPGAIIKYYGGIQRMGIAEWAHADIDLSKQ